MISEYERLGPAARTPTRPPAIAASTAGGALRLTTTGRRTGQQRSVIIGYFEDGPDLVSLAMNGWGECEPRWWLNLQAHPVATVDLVDGRRLVRGHTATGDEQLRLWARWREIDTKLDAYAALRSSETAVVVLEPRPCAPDAVQGSSIGPAWLYGWLYGDCGNRTGSSRGSASACVNFPSLDRPPQRGCGTVNEDILQVSSA